MLRVLLLLAIGCSGTDQRPAPMPASPAQPARAASAAPFLPDSLGSTSDPWRGVVFTDPPGGSVEARDASGATTQLADGTIVHIKSMELPVTPKAPPSSANIEIDGRALVISAAHLLDEQRLDRSTDRAFAVYAAHDTCRNHCRDTVYLFARDGRRVKLVEGVQDVVVAWRPDGKQLAVGSICRLSSTGCEGWTAGTLWLVDLPAMTVRTKAGYTSPAYAPDGTLYVRDHAGAVFTFTSGAPREVWKPATKTTLTAPDPVEIDESGTPRFDG